MSWDQHYTKADSIGLLQVTLNPQQPEDLCVTKTPRSAIRWAMRQYVLQAGDAAKFSVLIVNLSSVCFVRCGNCISAKPQQAVGLQVWAQNS